MPANANFANVLPGYCHFSNATYCIADSYRHDVDWDLGPSIQTATFDSLYNSYDTTDLVISQNGTVNDNAHSENVDVYYHFGSVARGYARSSCQNPVDTSHNCNHWHVIYDNAEMVSVNDNDVFFKKVACHETGHTLGLEHPDVDPHGLPPQDWGFFACMQQGNILSPGVGPHNVEQINFVYSPF